MNYIKEMNAFFTKITFTQLSTGAIALWATLMHFNNLCGWIPQFSVSMSVLEEKSGLKNTTFKRVRRELADKGFITVTSRTGNRAALYKIHSLSRDFNQMGMDQNEKSSQTNKGQAKQSPKVDHKLDHKQDHKPAPLYKQDKTKDKQNNKEAADAIDFYQEHFGIANGFIAEDILMWIDDLSEELVLEAMKRTLKQNKSSWGYTSGILKSWYKKNFTSLRQVEAFDTARKNNHRQEPIKKEIVPNCFHENSILNTQKKRPPQADPEEIKEVDQMLKQFIQSS